MKSFWAIFYPSAMDKLIIDFTECNIANYSYNVLFHQVSTCISPSK
jgi:hypothetical protein